MQNKLVFTALVFIVALAARAQDAEFGLRRVLKATPIQNGNLLIWVSTRGNAPPSVTGQNNWRVQVTEAGGQKRSMTMSLDIAPEFDRFDPSTKKGTNIVTLRVPAVSLNNFTLNGASWTVVFSDGKYLLTAAQDKGAESGAKQAKSRDDADLYGSASFLTGVGTSPIWTIDIKASYGDTLQHIFHLKPQDARGWLSNTNMGLFADVQTNTDTKVPADNTEIDPDSIRASWKFFDTRRIGHKFYSMYWEVQPAGGEFNRGNPSSNFVGGGKLRFVTLPFDKLPIDFNPLIGLEAGENLNKPSVLFKRRVDLSSYNAIVRLVAGADADFHVLRPKIKDADDPYIATITGSWIARVPFTPEPFTISAFVPDNTGKISRQKVVSMRQNTRHNVRATLNWNVSKLVAFQIGYKYGSLPPLFELVNHQVTVGFVFKAKFAKWHKPDGS